MAGAAQAAPCLPGKEPEKPWQRWRHPPGCPDVDWCAGNGVCYWGCQDTDDDVPLPEEGDRESGA